MEEKKYYFADDNLLMLPHEEYIRVGDVEIGTVIMADFCVTAVVTNKEYALCTNMVQLETEAFNVICEPDALVATIKEIKKVKDLMPGDFLANYFLPNRKSVFKGVKKVPSPVSCTCLEITSDENYRQSILMNNFRFKANCINTNENDDGELANE